MERIGRYEILEEIGRGGFGRVYRANDPLMKCEVAIKVMSNADDPEMLARFRGEAAAARKLRHESIVTIYDVGDQQGVPYIVMEYLQGMDLQKIRDQRKTLTLVEKVRILNQVAAGLQVAHENGIVHRDVKPANIMVLKDGSVKIMDFGIARATRDGATHLTRTGMMVGTLQYIPPEQFEGHAADALADLWAFGVIAFQLFSGRNPFEAAETMQVIYNITSLRIPDLHQLNPELPPELCQLVQKLLQRDRSARYQSFEDVRIDLHPVLESLGAQEANRLVDDARVIAARGDLAGAHQIVRQVLDRYPSNTMAKQIRDHIITQIRSNEASRQVEELLKKGDQDLFAGNYEEALRSYGLACKLNPNSATARMRWERAQQLAERARRIRDAMNDARSRLAAGAARDAEAILAGILAEDPDNAEALSLLPKARQERSRRDEAARADAILYSRHLISQRQYAQALAVLDDCVGQVGDHADLRRAMEEVRRGELAGATQARVEAAVARANEHVRNADYGGASAVLTPLAAEFPANADIRELLKFVAEEEARIRRVAEQRAAQELSAARPPSGAVPVMKADRAAVIQRALEMSREREHNGQVSEAMHVLEVALSRYPDAQDLEKERLRLSTPKAPPIEWAPGAAPEAAAPPAVPVPPPVSGPVPLPAANPPLGPAPGRRTLWLVVAGVGTACAGLLYWQFAKPCGFGNPCEPVSPAASGQQQKAAASTQPRPPAAETAVLGSKPEETKAPEPAPGLAPKSGEKAEPALASQLQHGVRFSYRKGDAKPAPVTLSVNRSPLQAAVRGPGSWLSVQAGRGYIFLDLMPAATALAPGEYHQTVQVTSNRDSAPLDVALSVSAAPKSDMTRPVTQSHVTPPGPAPEAPKSVDQAPAPVPAVKKPYNGPKRGTANWAGTLPVGARLVLGESGVLEGGGTLGGNDIPPTDVEVSVAPPGLEVHTLPWPNAQRVAIANSSGATVYQIRIAWNIK
jgi:predicted Ser/Thr protein kinase/tetratricopeptide (TPR) repeat protein